jgi:hypothetical protein
MRLFGGAVSRFVKQTQSVCQHQELGYTLLRISRSPDCDGELSLKWLLGRKSLRFQISKSPPCGLRGMAMALFSGRRMFIVSCARMLRGVYQPIDASRSMPRSHLLEIMQWLQYSVHMTVRSCWVFAKRCTTWMLEQAWRSISRAVSLSGIGLPEETLDLRS